MRMSVQKRREQLEQQTREFERIEASIQQVEIIHQTEEAVPPTMEIEVTIPNNNNNTLSFDAQGEVPSIDNQDLTYEDFEKWWSLYKW